MVIKSGEPWLLWPNMVSYGINTGDIGKTFEGDTDFTLSMHIKILTKSAEKRTIFAKLPNYMGLDIEKENNNLMLILNLNKNGETKGKYIFSETEIGYDFNLITFRFSKINKILEILVNDILAIEYKLEKDESLSIGYEPHIIFGSGNFPLNDFNLNYCEYDIDFLMISKSYKSIFQIYNIKDNIVLDDSIVGLYDFKNHTDYKIYDLSENCNFLHKII
jgi:hypothetical protein